MPNYRAIHVGMRKVLASDTGAKRNVRVSRPLENASRAPSPSDERPDAGRNAPITDGVAGPEQPLAGAHWHTRGVARSWVAL